jgi:hypothetical protein
MDAEEKNIIRLLLDIIHVAPNNSTLNIHGFYMYCVTEESYQKIFNLPDYSKRQGQSNYVIQLTSYYKDLLVDLINKEKNGFYRDMVHIDISYQGQKLLHAHDHMEYIGIVKDYFSPDFYQKIMTEYKNIEVNLLDKLKINEMK